MINDLAIVLVSGGMDSCVTAAIAVRKHREVAFLHVSYGQRTQAREKKAFADIADHFEIEKRLDISIAYLARIGGSALTDEAIEVSDADLENTEVPATYVPFRNANMLSIATSWAEVIDASSIYIGVVEEDTSGYPDCRREFIEAYQKVIDTGTRPQTKIKLKTPLLALSKAEIVKKGVKIDAPLELTWSCYRQSGVACGNCDSCALRLRGFEKAGVEDPIPYQRAP